MGDGKRVYVTVDGRHVLEEHPDAAFLVFNEYATLPDAVKAELEPKAAPAKKRGRPAKNKAALDHEDKGL